MKKKIFSILAISMLLIASLVSAMNTPVEIKGNGYIEVEGHRQFDSNKTLDELRRMAVLDAYRYLAEAIGDLHIESSSEMQNVKDLDDRVFTEVKKTVNGARLVSVTRDNGGNFTAVVRLNLYGGANSVANIIVPKDTAVEPFPDFNPKFLTMDSNYTGLIIDCGGQLMDTAVLPKIISTSGKEVYSFQYLDRNMVVNRGMVAYSDSVNSGVQRAGNNPLVIQGMVFSGWDVTVSDDDADKILAANSKSNFLKNCMVVFVK